MVRIYQPDDIKKLAAKNEWLRDLEKQAQEKREQKEREKKSSMQSEVPSLMTESNASLYESNRIKNEFGGRRRPIDSIKKFEQDARQENINSIATQLEQQSTLALNIKEIQHLADAVNGSDKGKRKERIPFSGAVRTHSPAYHRMKSVFSEDDTQLQINKEIEAENWKAFLKKQILEKELQKAKQHHLESSYYASSQPNTYKQSLPSIQYTQSIQGTQESQSSYDTKSIQSASKLPVLVHKKQVTHVSEPVESVKLNQLLQNLVEKKKFKMKTSKSIKNIPEKPKKETLVPRRGITSWPAGEKARLIQRDVFHLPSHHDHASNQKETHIKERRHIPNTTTSSTTTAPRISAATTKSKVQIKETTTTLPPIHKPLLKTKPHIKPKFIRSNSEIELDTETDALDNQLHPPLEQQLSNESLERQAIMSQIQNLWSEFIKTQTNTTNP